MKKVFVLVLLFLMCFSIPLFSQEIESEEVDPSTLSFVKIMDEFITGEVWLQWSEGEKLSFAIGFLQAFRLANIYYQRYDADGISYLRMNDVFEIIYLVDNYYNNVSSEKEFQRSVYLVFLEAFSYYMDQF